jgi:hypothetical protein
MNGEMSRLIDDEEPVVFKEDLVIKADLGLGLLLGKHEYLVTWNKR